MNPVYHDAAVSAFLPDKGAVAGQVVAIPVRGGDYLAELPAEEALQLFYLASFAATAVFESMGAQGTNILLVEGEGLQVNVLPRFQGDGIDLFWNPSRADPADLDRVASRVKDAFWYVGKEAKPRKDPAAVAPAPRSRKKADPRNDYKVRQLLRGP